MPPLCHIHPDCGVSSPLLPSAPGSPHRTDSVISYPHHATLHNPREPASVPLRTLADRCDVLNALLRSRTMKDATGARVTDDAGDVTDRVRQVIERLGCSQREFARRIVMDPSKLSRSLGGTRRFTVAEIVRIADIGRGGRRAGCSAPRSGPRRRPDREPARRPRGRPAAPDRAGDRPADRRARLPRRTGRRHRRRLRHQHRRHPLPLPRPRRTAGSGRALVHGRGHRTPRRGPRPRRADARDELLPADRAPDPAHRAAAPPVAGLARPVGRGRPLHRRGAAARATTTGSGAPPSPTSSGAASARASSAPSTRSSPRCG